MPSNIEPSPPVNSPAGPPELQPTLDSLMTSKPNMDMLSQRALQKFIECCQFAAEPTQTTQYIPAASGMNDFPHSDMFFSSPAEVAQRKSAVTFVPSPSPIYPVYYPQVLGIGKETSPTASDKSDDGLAQSGTHNSPSSLQSVSPKVKKRDILHRRSTGRVKSISAKQMLMRLGPSVANRKFDSDQKRMACFFCRGRKIACTPSVPGIPDRTCKWVPSIVMHTTFTKDEKVNVRFAV